MVGDFASIGIFGQPGLFDRFCSMAIFDDDQLIAACIYHNWHPDEGVIEFSGYSRDKRWLTRPVLAAMFAMPFERLGVQLVVMRVSEKDKPMRRIARSFGFTEYPVIARLRGRNEGEAIFTFSDDQWKASPYNRGKEVNDG